MFIFGREEYASILKDVFVKKSSPDKKFPTTEQNNTATDSSLLREKDNINWNLNIPMIISVSDISSDYTGINTRKFCQDILPDKQFWSRATLVQRIYCEFDEFLEDLGYWIWKGTPNSLYAEHKKVLNERYTRNKSEKQIRDTLEPKRGEQWEPDTIVARDKLHSSIALYPPKLCFDKYGDANPYCGNWGRFIMIHSLAIMGVTPGQYPRPYHLVMFLVTLSFVILAYHLIFLLGPGRVIRRFNYIHGRIIATNTMEVGLKRGGITGFSFRKAKIMQPLDSPPG